MKDHVRILVCGDEQVGKTSLIITLIARHFSDRVPGVMTDVHIPPEETDDDVHCTIRDCSALPSHRKDLLAKMKEVDVIVLLYDVDRSDTLTRLDTFWLPLIEGTAKDVPVVIVRNKVDKLAADAVSGGRSAADLSRQMAPLHERYKSVHISLECSSVTQNGLLKVFHEALNAALYPVAPMYDTKAEELRPEFERAMRRLFRVYDVDRDGLLADAELNAFQYKSFKLHLSEEDVVNLKKILMKESAGASDTGRPMVVPATAASAGGVTVDGFLRLMRFFIDRNQMKAPWKAVRRHHYDERLHLTVPPEVFAPTSSGGGSSSDQQSHELSSAAEGFLLSLFEQFCTASEGSSSRVLDEAGQAEVFGVIPDPTCAPWDSPRNERDYAAQDGGGLFGQLKRAPGSSRSLTAEAWIAHWHMLALHSPLLARAHLFYVGFPGDAGDMLELHRPGHIAARKSGRRVSATQVFVLGSRGCGKTRLVRSLSLGEDLRSKQRHQHEERQEQSSQGEEGDVETGTMPVEGWENVDSSTEGSPGGADDEQERIPEGVPCTCAGFACLGDDIHASGLVSPLCRFVTVTEVPEGSSDRFLREQVHRCDLAVMMFDPRSSSSLQYMRSIQDELGDDVPQIVVACESRGGRDDDVVSRAGELCKQMELLPPLFVVPETGQGIFGEDGLRAKIAHPQGPGLVAHEQYNRQRKQRRRTIAAAAALVTLGVVVGAGLYAVGKARSSNDKDGDGSRAGANVGGRRGEAGMGGAIRAPIRAAKRMALAAVGQWRSWRSGVAGDGVERSASQNSVREQQF